MPIPNYTIVDEPVAPDAAIAFWQQRAKLTYGEAKALGDGARHRAFYVVGLAQHDLVRLVSDGIEEALKNGETLADFKKRIQKAIKSQGWHSHRVENIFRTNMQTAYAAGRYAKMQAVKKSRPYWQYISVEDKRRRPSHAVLHGLVYPADHEFWGVNYPPNGFRCRCTVRTLSKRQVEKEGLSVKRAMPKATMWTDPKTGMEYHVAFPGADKGFRNNVGKDWLAGLGQTTQETLEHAPEGIARKFLRELIERIFAYWSDHSTEKFPLAILKKDHAFSIGSNVRVAFISSETFAKQKRHHPELTEKDYIKVQDAVEFGEAYKQDDKNIAFILNEAEGAIAIVKATKKGDELYVTSVRRLSRDEVKRDTTINALKRGRK